MASTQPAAKVNSSTMRRVPRVVMMRPARINAGPGLWYLLRCLGGGLLLEHRVLDPDVVSAPLGNPLVAPRHREGIARRPVQGIGFWAEDRMVPLPLCAWLASPDHLTDVRTIHVRQCIHAERFRVFDVLSVHPAQ